MGPSTRHVLYFYYVHVPVHFDIPFGDDVDDSPVMFAITLGG